MRSAIGYVLAGLLAFGVGLAVLRLRNVAGPQQALPSTTSLQVSPLEHPANDLAEDETYIYSPTDGTFSITFPGKPVEEIEKTPTGKLSHKAMFPGRFFPTLSVMYSDNAMPKWQLAQKRSREDFLVGFIEGQVEETKAKLLTNITIELNKHPGRAYSIQLGEATIR